MACDLLLNLDKVYVSGDTARRIERTLGLPAGGAERFCMEAISDPDTITKTEACWNVRGDGYVIAVDRARYEITSARRERPKKGSDMRDVNIVKRMDDIPELKAELARLFDQKTHRRISRYALLLAEHILEITNMPMSDAIEACFSVNKRWHDGDAKFQEAREVAFLLHEEARAETDAVRQKALRVLGQVAATPHVKRHALIASDYAVKVVNLMCPGDMDAVKRERETQIALMEAL